jgi:hypothetical protein
MRSSKETEKFIRAASVGANEARNASVLNRMQEAYANSAPAGSTRRPDYWGLVFESRLARFAAAAVILLSLAILIGQFGTLITGGNVAWADVTQRFQSVPFFSATIYMKDDAVSEPTQMELWMSRDGRVRLRMSMQVVFARGGKIIKAYDIKSRQPVEAGELATAFVEKIGQAGEFSLDAIIAVMFGGQATEVTPLVNPDAVISQDMVVFDVELPDTPEWVRIWALRESRLPVRISVWDPRDGGATDAVFTYSREQPDAFFDPNAFDGLLRSGAGSSRVGVAYAFLKDPGGRKVTPEEMFAESGYHMPVIEQVGITPDGAVWIIANKSSNRTPNGSMFFGFAKVQDDLGREYQRVYSSHRIATDRSTQVYVPSEYPFDQRTPARIVLTCREEHNPQGPPRSVGTLELTQWQQGRLWPEGTIINEESSFHAAMAWKHCNDKQFDKAERILSTIAGSPEDSAAALERERVRLCILLQQQRYAEAAALGKRLTPLLERDYRDWSGFVPTPTVFCDYIEALACAGEFDEARRTWEHIKSLQPELRPGRNEAAREHVREEVQRGFDDCLRTLIPRLSREAHLTLEQIEEILGQDNGQSGEYKRLIEQAKRDIASAESDRAVEQRRAELAAYYQTHPLPETAELVERTKDQKIYLGGDKNVLLGHDGYRILPINYAISGVVSNLRSIGAEKGDASRVHPYEAAMRFGEGLEDRELRADLVYKDGIELAECFHLVLAACGVELTTETLLARPVLVARYDGRKLRSHLEVHGPWHADDGRMGVRVWHIAELLEHLSQQMQAGVFIVDQTGLEEPVCIGGGNPQWQGAEGIEQARRWLQEQFGITITEETRAITIYLVQRRAQ